MLSILTTLLSLLITLSIANCSFHWVFSYLSSVSVISAFFDPENWLFLGKKKAPIWHFFGRIMKFFWSNHWRFHPDLVNSPPVSVGGASKKALFSVFLVVNILKFDINCTFFFLGLFSTYQAKNQKEDLGALPQTPLTCRGRRGMWQNLSTFPWAECWVDSKASRVKCTTASP